MLKAKHAPILITLCLALCLIGMALFTILMQSRAQSGALWAVRAAGLYANAHEAENLTGARKAMLKALQYDPYNAAYWMHLDVIEKDRNEAAPRRHSPINIIRGLSKGESE